MTKGIYTLRQRVISNIMTKIRATLLHNEEYYSESHCSDPLVANARNLKIATARRKSVADCLLFQKMIRLGLKKK